MATAKEGKEIKLTEKHIQSFMGAYNDPLPSAPRRVVRYRSRDHRYEFRIPHRGRDRGGKTG